MNYEEPYTFYIPCTYKKGMLPWESWIYFPTSKGHTTEGCVSTAQMLKLDLENSLMPLRIYKVEEESALIWIIDSMEQGMKSEWIPKQNIIRASNWQNAQYKGYKQLKK